MVAEGPQPASKDADSGIRSHPVDGSDEDNSNVIMEALQGSVQLLEEAVKQKETRLVTGRILRQTAAIRKQLDAVNLQRFVRETLPESLPARADLLQHLEKVGAGAGSMEMDGDSGVDGPDSQLAATASPLPEVEMFNYLLVIIFLIDSKADEQAKALTTAAVARLGDFNRRTLDVLAARIYFYYSWTYEKMDALADIRGKLMELHRTAVLRHDDVGQETLLNLLLRSYLHYNLYDQAEKLRSKVNLPEVSHSNQQYCRYLFYLGRIRAIRLEYTDAKDCLTQAARKAPSVALGFRIAVNKWLVLIHLLLGEIPQRTDFTQRGMATALLPYLHLTLAVRSGDLHDFQRVQEKYAKQFVRDRTQTLVVRLHHNVIRTGLKRITLAYSRISLEAVAARLGLPAVEDAECIVAKAIRDGGIDAWLDHENSCLHSQQQQDVYSTAEPLQSFHERIAFCLDVHNEAVKAMRYQPDEHRSKLQNAQDRMGMEQAMDYLADAEDDF